MNTLCCAYCHRPIIKGDPCKKGTHGEKFHLECTKPPAPVDYSPRPYKRYPGDVGPYEIHPNQHTGRWPVGYGNI